MNFINAMAANNYGRDKGPTNYATDVTEGKSAEIHDLARKAEV